ATALHTPPCKKYCATTATRSFPTMRNHCSWKTIRTDWPRQSNFMLLEGKSAIITGAGRGIGHGIAVAFAKQGCNVAITARTDAELETVASEIRNLGRTCFAESCDVSSEASADRFVQNAAEAIGGIDILVNNAGYA